MIWQYGDVAMWRDCDMGMLLHDVAILRDCDMAICYCDMAISYGCMALWRYVTATWRYGNGGPTSLQRNRQGVRKGMQGRCMQRSSSTMNLSSVHCAQLPQPSRNTSVEQCMGVQLSPSNMNGTTQRRTLADMLRNVSVHGGTHRNAKAE